MWLMICLGSIGLGGWIGWFVGEGGGLEGYKMRFRAEGGA